MHESIKRKKKKKKKKSGKYVNTQKSSEDNADVNEKRNYSAFGVAKILFCRWMKWKGL